jgi:histidine triad (HIT) family protein
MVSPALDTLNGYGEGEQGRVTPISAKHQTPETQNRSCGEGGLRPATRPRWPTCSENRHGPSGYLKPVGQASAGCATVRGMAALSDPGECVFCDIIAGRGEASVVHEDEHVIAFMDIRPVTEGHVLVVPRMHAAFLEDLDEDLGARVFRTGHRLARALRRSGLPCEGVNMFLADGEAAFQEVFHVHLHVFPRTVGDGFAIDARWRLRDREELDASAGQVRRGVRALSS